MHVLQSNKIPYFEVFEYYICNMKLENPPRKDRSEIEKRYREIVNSSAVGELLEQLPYQLLILDEDRQIVFGNNTFAQLYGFTELMSALALRPGEAIHCENADLGYDKCGTSEHCKFCAINRTFYKVKQTSVKEKSVGQLYFKKDDALQLLEYEVTISLFHFNSHKYFLVTIHDISTNKENEVFQRLFFHDILNISGSLNNVFRLLTDNPARKNNERLLKLAEIMSRQLTDEIIKEQQILNAEKGKLSVKKDKLNSLVILQDVFELMLQNKVAYKRRIQIDVSSVDLDFVTDRTLLLRILTNMLKNALEAEPEKAVINIGCSADIENMRFWVHNSSVLSDEIQHYIFNKSFSTKEVGRGLGTYSMKLFGEKFLGGKVGFSSSKDKGTIFYLELKI